MIPNSPVDPELITWGWPWHGPIRSPQAGQNGVLTLPSGAQMPCRYPHYNCTYLWDIGLPAPEVETENPDEQWRSKAILRSELNSGNSRLIAWYGGAQASTYPIYVPGRGTLRRRTEITLGANQQFRVASTVTGMPAVTKTLSRTDLGLDLPRNISACSVWLMDESPDGTRSLFLLVPYVQDFTQVEQFGRAIVELTYNVDMVEQVFTTSINVLSRYSDMISYGASSIQNQEQLDQNTMIQWLDGPELLASAGPPAGNPPSYPPPWVAAERRSYGTRTYNAEYETAVWAWYHNGSPELVKFRLEVAESESVGGTRDSRNGSSSTVVKTLISAGGSSADLSTTTSIQSTGTRTTTNNQYSYFAEEVLLYQHSDSVNYGINPGWQAQAPEVGVDVGASQINDGRAQLSNKLVAPRLQRVYFAFGATDYETWVGGAVHPGGVDPGRHTIKSTDPIEQRARWSQGSYNPVTGQVVRQQKDQYCTWV